MIIRLSGCIPFKGENYKQILAKNKACAIKYKKKDWKNVSEDGKNQRFIDFFIFYMI